MTQKLSGRVALVTGGGSGIGLAVARRLAAEGADVVVAGRRKDKLDEAVDAIGAKASSLVLDVTDLEAVSRVPGELAERGLVVDILVNNAGNYIKRSISDTADADFRSIQDTHVAGAYALTRACVPGMREKGRGRIIFIASMTAIFGLTDVSAYSAAKAATVGLTRSLAVELGSSGITVNAVAPGWIKSDYMLETLNRDPARKDKILSRTPLGRFGEGADIAAAITFLCAAEADFITGVVLPVDGGASIGF